MNELSIDFKSLLPHVIDAYTKFFGEEYSDIISKRLNSSIIIQYHDVLGLENYLSSIKSAKKREYAIKFLDKIGYDVKEHIKDNYMNPLDKNIEKLLEPYMDSSVFGFSKDIDYWVPLQAFKPDNETFYKKLLRNKITIINHLLGNEKVTEENFSVFEKTEEYQEILKKIDTLNEVYEKLYLEYREWEERFKPYDAYIDAEKQRKADILKRKKTLTFWMIMDKLPSIIKEAISDKSLEDQKIIILGLANFENGLESLIETFSYKNMEMLKSKDVGWFEKKWTIEKQLDYLEDMGVNISDEEKSNFKNNSDTEEYLLFLSRNEIKKYIPSCELIDCITSLRESIYEDAIKEYIVTKEDYLKALKIFDDNEGNRNYIYDQIRNKKVCIAGQGVTTSNKEFISLMFFTLRSLSAGLSSYMFIHECGHIITQCLNGTGLELFDDFNVDAPKNPYDKIFRKYEKFNETINDIFTIEVNELLQNSGIYLIEPEKYTIYDLKDINIASITKEILRPLLTKYRSQVISSLMNGNREELIRCIGRENFEGLNDVVNKVDYLSRNGVMSKLEVSPDDEMVKEYYEQLERAKQIYENIDIYYKNNIDNYMPYYDEVSIKK